MSQTPMFKLAVSVVSVMLGGLPAATAVSPLDKLDRAQIPDKVADRLPAEVVAVVPAPLDFLKATAISSDGSTLAFGRDDGRVQLWHLDGPGPREGALLKTEFPTALAFAPDGRTLAVADGRKKVTLWDVSRPSPKPAGDSTSLDVLVAELAFAPDGKSLATVTRWEETLRLWNIERGTLRLRLTLEHDWKVASVAFSPDGRTLATGGIYSAIQMWDVQTGEARPPLSCNKVGGQFALAFSLDGRTLASEGKGGVTLWEVATRQVRAELLGLRGQLAAARFSATNRLLTVSGWNPKPFKGFSDSGEWTSILKVWTTTGESPFEWKVDGHFLYSSWAADGRHLIVRHETGSAYVLRLPR